MSLYVASKWDFRQKIWECVLSHTSGSWRKENKTFKTTLLFLLKKKKKKHSLGCDSVWPLRGTGVWDNIEEATEKTTKPVRGQREEDKINVQEILLYVMDVIQTICYITSCSERKSRVGSIVALWTDSLSWSQDRHAHTYTQALTSFTNLHVFQLNKI